MEAATRCRALESEGRRALEAGRAHLDAPVPTCPGWDVHDLFAHLGTVWAAIETVVASGSLEPPDLSGLAAPPAARDEVADWAGERLDRVVAVLAATDPDRPQWTWSRQRTAGFYHRRAHLETLVHRVDVELAVGERTPVDAEAALDGIDELYRVVVPSRERILPTGTLHLHRTDGAGEFMLAVVDGEVVVTDEHGKGDAALRGPAVDLWLAMWRRGGTDHLELFGDVAVAEQWTGLAP